MAVHCMGPPAAGQPGTEQGTRPAARPAATISSDTATAGHQQQLVSARCEVPGAMAEESRIDEEQQDDVDGHEPRDGLEHEGVVAIARLGPAREHRGDEKVATRTDVRQYACVTRTAYR